jgi:HD-like signal output (HDOD) protein
MAVNLLGFKTVCNFVLSTAVRGIIDQPPTELFAISVLWQDSLRRAVFARNFAVASQHPAPEEVFTGALLQDLAIPLLIASKPVEYEKILRTARVEKRRIHELEEDAFGWNHAEVGARLCESWNFPPDLVSMIRQHLIPTSTFKETNSERIVTVTAFLPTESSPEWTEQARLEKCIRMLIPNTNPQELYAKTDNDFVQLATAINVSANCRALTRWSAPKAV